MSRILKTSLSVSVFMLMAVVGHAAHADSVNGSNNTTGYASQNTNTTSVSSNNTVTENNDSHTTNNVTINANTGGNNANENTVGGAITTGSISGAVVINNMSNNGSQVTNAVMDPHGGFSVTTGNALTGAQSENRNSTSISGNNVFSLNNNAVTNNNVVVNANTGRNNSNRNTVGGDISTGDINTLVNINNTSNSPGKGSGGQPNPSNPPGSVLGLATGGALSSGKGGGQVLAAAGSNGLVLSLVLALIITIGITQAQRSRKHVVRLE
jgi:hypothetical protein